MVKVLDGVHDVVSWFHENLEAHILYAGGTAGPNPRTYELLCNSDETGLWCTVDGVDHPVLTRQVMPFNGTNIRVQYRSATGQLRELFWNDINGSEVYGLGGVGSNPDFSNLSAPNINHTIWSHAKNIRTFRITCPQSPTGLYVHMPGYGPKDLPIPSMNGHIDVSGRHIVVVADGDAITNSRTLYWKDIT